MYDFIPKADINYVNNTTAIFGFSKFLLALFYPSDILNTVHQIKSHPYVAEAFGSMFVLTGIFIKGGY